MSAGGRLPRLRSLLFSPGNVPKMLLKGWGSGADALVLDLEDSIPAQAKAIARQGVRDFLVSRPAAAQAGALGPLLIPRVNALSSGLLVDDLAGVCRAGVAALTVPKVESKEEMLEVVYRVQRCSALQHMEPPPLLPWIETAKGLVNAYDIASCSPHIAGLCFGRDDLLADMGVDRGSGFESALCTHARTVIAVAARAARVQALDTPWVDLRADAAAVKAYVERAKALGLTGMFAIHPSHVVPLNESYSPDVAALERARAIVTAFVQAASSGSRGALSVEGQMIDVPVLRQQLNVLESSPVDAALVGAAWKLV